LSATSRCSRVSRAR